MKLLMGDHVSFYAATNMVQHVSTNRYIAHGQEMKILPQLLLVLVEKRVAKQT